MPFRSRRENLAVIKITSYWNEYIENIYGGFSVAFLVIIIGYADNEDSRTIILLSVKYSLRKSVPTHNIVKQNINCMDIQNYMIVYIYFVSIYLGKRRRHD